MVLSPDDEEVASSKKNTQFKTRVLKPYLRPKWSKLIPSFRPKGLKKTPPFGAAHTYITYIRGYPPGSILYFN